MKIKTDNYVCSICGKRKVKLWRPYMDTGPLVCAECAEKRQVPQEYEEVIWKRESGDCYIGKTTGKKIPLSKWKVDEKGCVPSYDGPGPKGKKPITTDQLIVNLTDVSKVYTSGNTNMIPACPDEDGTCVKLKWNIRNLYSKMRKQHVERKK